MCTWEAVLITAGYGLTNGGLAGMVWMFLITLVGFSTAILSMAEMASMAPTSGGQYHWVSEFAPRSAQKFLSFVTGWLCVLGWQVNIASGGYIIATIVTGLAALLNPEGYAYEPYHGTLIIIAVNVTAIVFNTFFARKLPLIEGLILVIHVFGFFAILIPLWVFSPRTPVATVFTDFENNGGWSSIGLACLVGMTGPVYALIGPDSAVHMCMFRGSPTPLSVPVTDASDSRGNQGRVARAAARHAVDRGAQRPDGLHHGHHLRLLHRRHRERHLVRVRLRLHPGLLQLDRLGRRHRRHDGHHRPHGPVQHYQQRGHGLAPDVRLCARRRPTVRQLLEPRTFPIPASYFGHARR